MSEANCTFSRWRGWGAMRCPSAPYECYRSLFPFPIERRPGIHAGFSPGRGGAKGDADPTVVDHELRYLIVLQLGRLGDLFVDDVQLAVPRQNFGKNAAEDNL